MAITPAQKQASAQRRKENRARGRARGHARVRARPIRAGASWKITRRSHGQVMFWAPRSPAQAKELTNFIGYCLAYAATKYGIQIHACLWMSNHHHTDVTDPEGNLVGFKQLLHSLIARGRNAQLGRNDTMWSGDEPCDTWRSTDDDQSLGDLVYTLTNPVEAGLVKWARLWPGFTTMGWRFGETRTFRRPDALFDEDGEMPKEVTLTLTRPPIFRDLDDDALYRKLMDAVRTRELAIQDEFRRESRRFMGTKKLARQPCNRAPQSFEERFNVKPHVAGSSRWKVRAGLQRNREWERQYAEARKAWLAGEPAVFPAGTYWLKRFAGVAVAQAP